MSMLKDSKNAPKIKQNLPDDSNIGLQFSNGMQRRGRLHSPEVQLEPNLGPTADNLRNEFYSIFPHEKKMHEEGVVSDSRDLAEDEVAPPVKLLGDPTDEQPVSYTDQSEVVTENINRAADTSRDLAS